VTVENESWDYHHGPWPFCEVCRVHRAAPDTHEPERALRLPAKGTPARRRHRKRVTKPLRMRVLCEDGASRFLLVCRSCMMGRDETRAETLERLSTPRSNACAMDNAKPPGRLGLAEMIQHMRRMEAKLGIAVPEYNPHEGIIVRRTG